MAPDTLGTEADQSPYRHLQATALAQLIIQPKPIAFDYSVAHQPGGVGGHGWPETSVQGCTCSVPRVDGQRGD